MDISTAYEQHQRVKNLHDDIAEVQKEMGQVDFAYKVAFVGTFILYFCFVWAMYVSDLWGFTTWLTDNLSEVAALVIYGVLAFALPLTMALIKELAYRHFSKYPNNKALIAMIVFILAMAGVVYESIVSSSQQQHISFKSAESSESFRVITETTTNTAAPANMAVLIAEAQKQLARCKEKLKAGTEPHCRGDAAKLQGYLDSEQRAFDSAERASVAAIKAKTDAIQDLKEENHKPVFKSIRDSFGVSINTGVMVVTIFVSAIFEISHLLLILLLAQKRRLLAGLKNNLINAEADYMRSTGKTFKSEDFADDSVLNMDDIRGHEPVKQPFGFAPSAVKQQPLFKYQKPQRQPMGFINPNTPTQQAPAKKPISAKLGTAEKQLNIPEFGRAELSTYNDELAEHGIHSPDDKALNKAADKADIQRIIDKGLNNGKATTPGTNTQPQKAGAPGAGKRALPVSGKQSTKVGAPGLDAELLAAMQDAMKDIPNDVLKEAGAVYPVWRGQVKERDIKPSKRDGFKFVSAQLCRGRKRTLTPASMVKLLSIWQLRAVSDGVLRVNPNQRNGAAKFLLIG